ncbi:MAG: DMT family transporter [Candidatus Eremiobacteraeota bacterium]|nr:DMT family transporter [Candidatus Eremiobacteraeota bacterium]
MNNATAAAWTVTLAALGMFAGANLAFQALVNTQLRAFVTTPLRASFVSYIGGTLACFILLVLTRQSLNIYDPAIKTNWLLWTGGAYGLVYIATLTWLIPRLGSGAVFALMVAGQMIGALLIDQFGVLGTVQRPVDVWKLAGVAFTVVGVVLIRR